MDIKIGEMDINVCEFLFMLGLLAPVAAENKFGDHGIILTARPKDNADDYKQLLTIPETPRKVPDYPSRTFPGIKFDDVRMKLHACDVDYDQNMIYMYDYNYRTLIVGSNFSTSMNKDNINFTTEHYGISREYVKVAVDWVSHNVYWTDTVMGAIVMQPGGQGINQTLYKVIVNKDLDLPRGIAVDPISGYLFWSDFAKHSKIERASLIGEDRTLLVANALYIPDAITADHASQRIYFTNYQSIESVSYDGTDRKLLVKNTQAYFFDIAIYGDVVMATDIQAPRNLYFYDTATGKEAVPKEGSNDEDFYGVCMYHKDVQPSIAQDRCSTAGCEDICVDDPSKTTATCLCRTGFEVNADQKTCSSVGGQYHRAVVLNNGTHLCLLDIRILSDHHTHKVHCFYHHTEPSEMITYIDINGRTREVYFSTDTAIYRVPIDKKNARAVKITETLPSTKGNGKVTGLSYDYVSGHLYWSETNPDAIFLMNPDAPAAEFLQLTTDLHNITYPRAVLVLPHERQLLWLSGNGTYEDVVIQRTDLGASAPVETIIPEELPTNIYLFEPTHMLNNVKDRRLYILDAGWREILLFDFDGSYLTDYDTEDAKDFALYQDFILVAKHDENNKTALFSADLGFGPPFKKIVEEKDGVVEDIGHVVSMKILDVDVLQPESPNPCRDLNGKGGGCDQICIALGGQAVCKCDIGFTLSSDGKSCDSIPVIDNFILVTDTTHSKIHQIPLDQPDMINGISTVSQTSLTGVFFNYLTKRIILGSEDSDQIWSVNFDGSNETMLADISSLSGTPNRFALDPSTGNLYFTGVSHWSWWFDDYSFVGVISPNGYSTLVYEGGNLLGDIVLHPEKGYMFWTDYGSSPAVNRASMDGSNKIVIASGADVVEPNGLAIDYSENALYWTDDTYKRIYKSDLDGNDMVTFLEEDGIFGDIRIVGDYMYYTVKEDVQVTRIHLRNTSNVIKFGSSAGIGVLGSLDVYLSSEVSKIPKHDVCSINIGECSHFCLPNEAGGRSCGCENYYSLLIDGKTCENVGCPKYTQNSYIDEDCLRVPGQKCAFTCFGDLRPKEIKLLSCRTNLTWDDDEPCRENTYKNKYGDYGVVLTARGFSLDDFRQVVGIPTTPRDIPNYPARTFPGFRFPDIKKKLHACDVDYHMNMLYMYDYQYRTIIVGSNFSMDVNLNAMNFTTEHYGVSQEFVKIAVDWISHNIYWTDTVMGTIMMQPGRQNISPALYRIVIQDHLDLPRGIAVDPLEGYMFWTDISKNSKIERANLLGENRRALPINSLYVPDAIAADHTSKRIYFTNFNSIESATYDGLERTHVVKNSQAYFFDVAVFNGVIMATDISKYYVYFYDALTGQEVAEKEGSSSEGFFGVCMYHERAQPQTPQELCLNAGCEDICVEEPNAVTATCLCRTGSELQPDGTCKEDAGQYQRAILLNNGTHLCLLDIRILSDHHDHKVNCFYQHLEENETVIFMDVNMKSREVYYSTLKSIYRVPIDIGPNDIKASKLTTTPGDRSSGQITGLSYDWINNHLYWSQTGPDGVFLINPDDPKEFKQIATKEDTYLPYGVLVVPHIGQLFWISSNRSSENTSFIEYGDLGLSRPTQTIVRTGDEDLRIPTHIVHDNKKDQLYILDIGWGYILQTNYTGTLTDYFASGDAKDFALYNDYLLIMEHDDEGNTRLYSGDIGLGSPLTVTADGKVEDIGTVISMKIVDVNVLQKTYASPCGEKEGMYGGCEQICIPVDNKPSCRCDTGFTLNADGKTCDSATVSDDFILVSDNLHSKVYQIPLDKPDEVHGIKIPNKDNPSGILYNYLTNKIVFGSGDSSQIWSVNIDGTNATFIADIDEWYGTPTHFAIDPSTGNIFITAFSYYATYFQDSFIAAVSPSGGVAILYDQGHILGDIVLHPAKGFMFWTDYAETETVNRAGMDGSDVTVISDGDHTSYPTGLAIDYEAEEIYWQDALLHKILKSDFDGNNRQVFFEEKSYMVDIRLFGDYLYYTGLDNLHLTKINKYDTSDATRIGPKSGVGTFGTLDIYSSSLVSKIPVNDACSKDNGNCSHFCLPNGSGGRTCGCEGYYELLSDGKTCENAPRCQGVITGGIIDEDCHRLAGQQCDYRCNNGFRRKDGVVKLLCQELTDEELRWDDETPCEEIFCPAIIPNGQLPGNCTLKVDASCGDYTCNPGYEKNNDISSLTCTMDGTWSTDILTLCNVKCPVLTMERDMATLAKTCKREPEEQCGYTCKEHFKPTSSITMIKCLSGSQWNVMTERLCEEILCPDYIPNGLVHTNCSFTVGSTCTFSCGDRFKPSGRVKTISCLPSGNWDKVSGDNSICKAIPVPKQKQQSDDLAIGLGVGIGILVLIIIVIFVVIMLHRKGNLFGRKSGGSGSAFENPRYQESSFDAPPGATGESNKDFSYATLEEDKLELTDESWRKRQSRASENVYDNSPATLPASAVNPKF